MKNGVLIESHFLPSLEYFCALLPYESICLEAHEHFVKQSYRNRCYVLAVHGVERLTVPLTGRHGKVPFNEVRIDYSFRWQANVWRTIQSAYAQSPYFEHYADELRHVIFSGEEFLYRLNRSILSMCLHWLRWNKTITETVDFRTETDLDDLRNVISSKSEYTGRSIFRPVAYQQVFGSTFVPNLSVLDLVCCAGPESGSLLAACAGQPNK